MFKRYLLIILAFLISVECINVTSVHARKVVISRHVEKNFSSDFKELNKWLCGDAEFQAVSALTDEAILRKADKLSMMLTVINVFRWFFMLLLATVFSFIGSRFKKMEKE